jgi:predicted TIM-barrel fold metal-dependent hydrolase
MFESLTRRRLFKSLAAGLAGVSVSTSHSDASIWQDTQQPSDKGSLLLTEFEPRSMLHVKETPVPRARFPVIDVHTHITRRTKSAAGVSQGEAITISAPPGDILPAMDRRNIRIMVNLTGSAGEGLSQAIRTFQQPHPDRFVVFTEPSWDRVAEPGYARWQADELGHAKAAGARGIKVLKTLGLYVREQVTSGPLIPIDDKRFDPMWEACGALGFPVAIHIADPEAFFLPIDRFNERYEELHEHPNWSFYGKDYPSFDALIAARDRVLARHPKTTFIGLHVGHDAENLARVGEALDKYPNLNVEIGARIGELGRQPRTARKFFERYQDRILFGTDAIPGGTDTPQQLFGDNLYSIYFRFLETEDEYFDYAPAKIPPQGRWRIYGLGLPDEILKKVYYANAERIIGIPPANTGA